MFILPPMFQSVRNVHDTLSEIYFRTINDSISKELCQDYHKGSTAGILESILLLPFLVTY